MDGKASLSALCGGKPQKQQWAVELRLSMRAKVLHIDGLSLRVDAMSLRIDEKKLRSNVQNVPLDEQKLRSHRQKLRTRGNGCLAISL